MRSKVWVFSASIAIVATLTACGSQDPAVSTTTAPPAPIVASTSPSASPTPSPSWTPPPLAGIVVGMCTESNTQQQIAFINPANGEEDSTLRRSLTYNQNTHRTYGICGIASDDTPGYKLRSAYNETFDVVAANTADDNHAGVIKFDFEDLSGITEDGFGIPPKQSPGAIGPDGRLYFVQETPTGKDKFTPEVMSVDLTDGLPPTLVEQEPDKDIDKVSVSGNDASYGVHFVPGHPQPLLDFSDRVIYSDDGKTMFRQERVGGSLFYGNPDKPSTLSANLGEPVPAPIGYISPTSYLGLAGSSDLVLANIVGEKVTVKSLFEVPTDGEIIDPTVSPDGKTIAFILDKDGAESMFTIPTFGKPTMPTKLATPVNNAIILDWV
jgi:hypothetical protein